MSIYLEGGLVMTLIYAVTRAAKKIIPTRFIPLIPLVLTPLAGGLYAYITGSADVIAAVTTGFQLGAGTIAAHEFKDHVIQGKE